MGTSLRVWRIERAVRVVAFVSIMAVASVGCGTVWPSGEVRLSASASSAVAESPAWWSRSGGGVSTCGQVAFYRIEGRVAGLGGCAGVLPDPPAQLTMRVGQSLDLALVPGFGGHGTTTSDDSVLRLIGGPQADATVAYSAVATGEALLTTTGAFCVNLTTYEQSSGVCPLLAVSVVE